MANYIDENIEDMTRFVSQVLQYPPSEVWKMNVYEFFRDVNRARKMLTEQRKNLEKWQSK